MLRRVWLLGSGEVLGSGGGLGTRLSRALGAALVLARFHLVGTRILTPSSLHNTNSGYWLKFKKLAPEFSSLTRVPAI